MNNEEIIEYLEKELVDRWRLGFEEGGKTANLRFIIGYNKGTIEILKSKMEKESR